ncbi:hypothetical protein MP228_009769 [Amoeboaphelidium protococcarum]|nr:hypothetical protein MP228_009769 [Amoeboaphelidium protococcarum]
MPVVLDYYGILGVSERASNSVIKDAYRKLALKHHPDKNPNDNRANLKFQYVNDAYAILSDPSQRRRHDQERRQSGATLFNPMSSESKSRSQYHQQEEDEYEPQVDADNLFGSEFEDMLRNEMRNGSGNGFMWSLIGALCGLGLGFIIFNIPGALVGLAIGRYLGGLRDTHGRSVLEVFQTLPQSERSKILATLARKLFNGVMK